MTVPTRVTATLERLRMALTDKVASAVLYGSYVRGEFRPQWSDINLAVVLRDDDLVAVQGPLREAWRAARVDPWIARADELSGLVDVFAIRVRDIQRRHEVLVGDDPWSALVVPRAALRVRLEQELRNLQMRLRHVQVISDGAGQSRQLYITAGALRVELATLAELAGGTAHESIRDSGARRVGTLPALPVGRGAEPPVGSIEAVAADAAARLDLPRDEVHAVLAYRATQAGNLAALLATTTRLLARAVAIVDTMEDS